MKKRIESIRGRVGPLGSALAAAALTAAAFAAISVAADGGSDGDGDEVRRAGAPMMFEHRVGPPPGLPAEDREAMEAFRKCMEENGAELPVPPEPPKPGELRRGERPEPPQPPSEEEREAIEEALEACEDQLPEGAHFGIGPCGEDDDAGEDEGEDEGAREEREEDGAEMEGAATS